MTYALIQCNSATYNSSLQLKWFHWLKPQTYTAPWLVSSLNRELFQINSSIHSLHLGALVSCNCSRLSVSLLSVIAVTMKPSEGTTRAPGDSPQNGASACSRRLSGRQAHSLCARQSLCYQMASRASLSWKGEGGNKSQLSVTSSLAERKKKSKSERERARGRESQTERETGDRGKERTHCSQSEEEHQSSGDEHQWQRRRRCQSTFHSSLPLSTALLWWAVESSPSSKSGGVERRETELQ